MVRLIHHSDIENVYDEPDRAGRLAGLLAALDGPDSLVVGTGDDTAPGTLALVERGRQAIPFFSAAGTDLETFGNHDFDFGPDATRDLVADAPVTWVSANVRGPNGERFAADAGVVPWTVHEVDGARIGFVGLTDPATGSLNPSASTLTFTDPFEAAAAGIDRLCEAGVDHLVALSHLGAGDESLAREFEFDVVLGGHVHSERIDWIDGTLLTRPGVGGRTVIEVVLDGDLRAIRHDPSTAPIERRLADDLRNRLTAAGLDDVVGHTQEPIQRDEASIFGGECRIGNLVADAFRWAVDADVGLQNSGGIRSGPDLAGEVTVGDLMGVVPFEEPVVRADISGAELIETFREAASPDVAFGQSGWWHGHVSGATLLWDDGELVDARVGNEAIDPEATYTVGTAAYLLHSTQEFPTLEDRHRVADGPTQYDTLIDYVRENGLDSQVEGRVRQ